MRILKLNLILPSLVLLSFSQFTFAGTSIREWKSGPADNRINIAILGDGYTQTELTEVFAPTVDSLLAYLLNHPKMIPYPRYKNFLNIYRIDMVSPQSGVDNLTTKVYKDTPLGGENGCTDYTLGVCGVNWKATHDSLSNISKRQNLKFQWVLVLLNDSSFNAAAHYPAEGPLAVYSAHYFNRWDSTDIRDIAMHEAGHAWHYLADEYFYTGPDNFQYVGGEPTEVNVTTDPQAKKWQHWLGYQMPSGIKMEILEGARYFQKGVYRPSSSSKMNGGPENCHFLSNKCTHNMVGIEKIIHDIYDKVKPIDSFTDTSLLLDNPEQIALKVIDTSVIHINWIVNSDTLLKKSSGQFDVKKHLTKPGQYTVKAHVYDGVVPYAFSSNSNPHPLDLVRTQLSKLQQVLSWKVKIGNEVTDIPSFSLIKEIGLHIGPNKSLKLVGELPSGNSQIVLKNHLGKQVAVVQYRSGDEIGLNLLSSGLYIAEIYQEQGRLLKKKIFVLP